MCPQRQVGYRLGPLNPAAFISSSGRGEAAAGGERGPGETAGAETAAAGEGEAGGGCQGRSGTENQERARTQQVRGAAARLW